MYMAVNAYFNVRRPGPGHHEHLNNTNLPPSTSRWTGAWVKDRRRSSGGLY